MIAHILNGDALDSIFPLNIEGERFVNKECLCDGEVKGKTLNDFFENRASFIASSYEGFSKDDYFNESVVEFEKIQDIPSFSQINLWFEEDVFCQINFWFVVDLLYHRFEDSNFYLVPPKKGCEYCFSNMSEEELENSYENKVELILDDLQQFSNLWVHYKSGNYDNMHSLAKRMRKFPFVIKAVDAIIEDKQNNKVQEYIQNIIDESESIDFTTVFKEFHKKAPIYGYGDLQIKRIYENLI